MKSKIKTFLKQLAVGSVFFGTLVGAGFASGKETWTYFANFGLIGYASIFIACALFFLCGIVFLNFGKRFHVSTVQDMNKLLFKKYAIVAEIIMVFCNLILLSSMLAGANSLFNLAILPTSFRIDSVITAIIALFVVWFGFSGLTKANGVVVPLLLSVLLVCLFSDLNHLETYEVAKNLDLTNIVRCLLYCVLFVSSNMFFAGFIFSKLGMHLKKTEIVGGCAVGTLFLCVSLFLMSVVLFLNPQSHQSDMPLVSIAGTVSPVFSIFTVVVIWIGLITTAIALLYTITNWLKTYINNTYLSSILVVLLAMLFSGIGFGGFITYVYPFLGAIGLVYVLFVFRIQLRNARLSGTECRTKCRTKYKAVKS